MTLTLPFVASMLAKVTVILTPTKGPHGFLVIDHVERPTPNCGPRILPPTVR